MSCLVQIHPRERQHDHAIGTSHAHGGTQRRITTQSRFVGRNAHRYELGQVRGIIVKHGLVSLRQR